MDRRHLEILNNSHEFIDFYVKIPREPEQKDLVDNFSAP